MRMRTGAEILPERPRKKKNTIPYVKQVKREYNMH